MESLITITAMVITADSAERIEWGLKTNALFKQFSIKQDVMCKSVMVLDSKLLGFAHSMNKALQQGIVTLNGTPSYVLCFNDDLDITYEMLSELWKHRQDALVTCPTTNYTKCAEQHASAPVFEPPRRSSMVPAICWLIPWPMVNSCAEVYREKWLFDETIGRAWGEDDYCAAIWRKKYDPKPFLIAPTAWVHHHGSRTSSLIPEAEKAECLRRANEKIAALERTS